MNDVFCRYINFIVLVNFIPILTKVFPLCSGFLGLLVVLVKVNGVFFLVGFGLDVNIRIFSCG